MIVFVTFGWFGWVWVGVAVGCWPLAIAFDFVCCGLVVICFLLSRFGVGFEVRCSCYIFCYFGVNAFCVVG